MCVVTLWAECRYPLRQISALSVLYNVSKGLRNVITKSQLPFNLPAHSEVAYNRSSRHIYWINEQKQRGRGCVCVCVWKACQLLLLLKNLFTISIMAYNTSIKMKDWFITLLKSLFPKQGEKETTQESFYICKRTILRETNGTCVRS